MILIKSRSKNSIIRKVIFYIIYGFVLFIIGTTIQRFGIIGNVIIPYIKSEERKLFNYIKPFEGEVINIDIPFDNFNKLKQLREDALQSGLLQNSIYVSCKINNKDIEYSAKIRLKGDMLEHVMDKEKWSFRIKFDGGNNLWGMKKFSIHHPIHRNYLNEWLFHKTLKTEEIISLRYFFIKVILNGNDLGIYAVEENFDERLIENNDRRDGIIIRFDEQWDWIEYHQFRRFKEKREHRSGYGSFYSLPISTFNRNKVNIDSIKIKQFNNAHYLMDGFRSGNITTTQAFDIKKLAKYFALVDLLGGLHGSIVQNIRFYYNPITNKLEPVGFDASPGTNFHRLSFMIEQNNFDPANTIYFSNLFKDINFFELYIKELYNYSNISYLDKLFESFNDEIIVVEHLINYEWPSIKLDKAIFFNNSEYIRNILKPEKCVEANLISKNNNKIIIDIGNLQKLPITNFYLILNDSIFQPLDEKLIIIGREFNQQIDYHRTSFSLNTDQGDINIKENTKIELKFNILGLEQDHTTSLNTYASKNERFPLEQEINYNTFQFLHIDEKDKKIFFSQGKNTVDKDIIFPSGYEIIVFDSTEVNFINSSGIYSQSPFICIGSEEWPIRFTSEDSTSNGILIYNSSKSSIFQYCNFSKFINNVNLNWIKTGAVTSYESPLIINHCYFSNNKTEDALNIIRSEFKINNSVFYKNKFDAIDIDYSEGIIRNSNFYFSGNDALDFSGSKIELKSLNISNAEDKAISIGELSKINGEDIHIINSNLGIVNKDMSSSYFNDITIDSVNIAIAVFQKKSEFGPAKLGVHNISINSCAKEFLVENGSELKINGVIHPSNITDAIYVIYGN